MIREELNTFPGIAISESQVYRVTDCLGQQVAPGLLEEVRQPQLEDGLRASIDAGRPVPEYDPNG